MDLFELYVISDILFGRLLAWNVLGLHLLSYSALLLHNVLDVER